VLITNRKLQAYELSIGTKIALTAVNYMAALCNIFALWFLSSIYLSFLFLA